MQRLTFPTPAFHQTPIDQFEEFDLSNTCMGVLLLETCFVCSVNTQPAIMQVMQCLQFTTNRPESILFEY